MFVEILCIMPCGDCVICLSHVNVSASSGEEDEDLLTPRTLWWVSTRVEAARSLATATSDITSLPLHFFSPVRLYRGTECRFIRLP